MKADVLADLGHLFLGSRLKRLAERMQADAAKVHRAMGVHAQPAELALLAALDLRGPSAISAVADALGVSQPAVTRTAAGLVERTLIASESDAGDLRQRTLKLTAEGRDLVARAKTKAWPAIDGAVAALCEPLEGTLLEQIAALERQLETRPLDSRALALTGEGDDLEIVDYSDALAKSFYEINAEWISSMFTLEDKDRAILEDPRGSILDAGGIILFARTPSLGVLGTCALMRVDDGVFELTKMGVLESARGKKAGELLLRTALSRADTMGIETLYLLTSSKCASAIHLYEKVGFEHDAGILRTYGSTYARCDVGMRYCRPRLPSKD